MWKREQILPTIVHKKFLQFDPIRKYNFLQTLLSNFNCLIDYCGLDIISCRKTTRKGGTFKRTIIPKIAFGVNLSWAQKSNYGS